MDQVRKSRGNDRQVELNLGTILLATPGGSLPNASREAKGTVDSDVSPVMQDIYVGAQQDLTFEDPDKTEERQKYSERGPLESHPQLPAADELDVPDCAPEPPSEYTSVG